MENAGQKERFLIIDGDDTLWDVESLYETARSDIRSLVASVGVDADDWEHLQRQIDLERFEVERFSPLRFPGSCVAAYLALTAQEPSSEADSMAERIDELARRVFSAHAPLAPGAKVTMARLHSNFRLLLLTQGDLTIQRKRISDSGLAAFFDHLVITEHKDKDVFQQAIAQLGGEPSKGWSIGNSLASDIEPALQCGLRAILVRSTSWEFERRSSNVSLEDIELAPTLSEVVPILVSATTRIV